MSLKALERRVRVLIEGYHGIPTFEQFQEEWKNMDDLSKSLFALHAECPELFGGIDERETVIAGYLERMGLVKEKYSLADLMEGIEDDPN